ncbi:hypothetical protein CP985_04150 [Malaciobacter mytili LMG 24559]|uniref:Uncharacterized protein n=1 Tax=Malaciobacter mytili LMG 24559 TaxID=1032238 RepID=A0AAX2AIB2_9BACT|nr:hypothetical protein [Malaciobacter mytili]AXH13746.1 hypothetical protein AMYT_0121 [Malaciobacter mytili LMG 24559]RXK16355.1 hypothetical protein CP985_04150 [Malaciobacter mytili LMG 24559]
MDSLHTIKRLEKKKKLIDLKLRVKAIKYKMEESKLLDKEEKEYLNFSIDYILFIMDKYKESEGMDI